MIYSADVILLDTNLMWHRGKPSEFVGLSCITFGIVTKYIEEQCNEKNRSMVQNTLNVR